jgi:hypothetical protein
MARVCAARRETPQSDRDLEASTSARHYEQYCLNAPMIDALNQKGELTDGGGGHPFAQMHIDQDQMSEAKSGQDASHTGLAHLRDLRHAWLYPN